MAPPNTAEFTRAIHRLGVTRRRDGATHWGLMHAVEEPTSPDRWFIIERWAEHLCQHDRISIADQAVQDIVHALHESHDKPVVRHVVSLHDNGPAMSPMT